MQFIKLNPDNLKLFFKKNILANFILPIMYLKKLVSLELQKYLFKLNKLEETSCS